MTALRSIDDHIHRSRYSLFLGCGSQLPISFTKLRISDGIMDLHNVSKCLKIAFRRSRAKKMDIYCSLSHLSQRPDG